MSLTFRWQFRVLGLQLEHALNAQTAITTVTSVIYFQAILSAFSIFCQMQFSWLPKSGSLSFLLWLFLACHSHKRQIPPQISQLWQRGSRSWCLESSRAWRGAVPMWGRTVPMWGRTWPRAGRGMSNMPDGNGDMGTDGQKAGKKEVWSWGFILAALACAVQEEGGWDGGEIDAMPTKYITNRKNQWPSQPGLCAAQAELQRLSLLIIPTLFSVGADGSSLVLDEQKVGICMELE